jgi:hypothetical protein
MISPFGNATVLPEAMWHPEATQRGTFGILSSCLITMSLCIWTAVHLNLPRHKKESQFGRKVWWLMLGLMAPEVVVWSAWRQRSKTNALSRRMRQLGFMAEERKMWERVRNWAQGLSTKIQVFLLLRAGGLPELSDSSKDKKPCHSRAHLWTDVHSWYVVMGGFAFEDNSAEELQFMHGNQQRMTLTDEAVLWLAENRTSLLPDVSRQHIEDKSKSGGLGKLVTCWQATYFCIQCAFRLSQRSSISLLELNVFAHASCALILFWIWWDKPQDVHEPTLITDKEGLDLCAFFSLKPLNTITWASSGNLFRNISSPAGSESRWIPRQPCSDFWEISTPTAVTTHHRREYRVTLDLMGNSCSRLVRLSFGPYRQRCLKVLGTFWTIETRKDFWPDGQMCPLDSRSIWRLTRAYGLAKEDVNFLDCPRVVSRCTNMDWGRLALILGFKDHSHYGCLFESRSKYLFRTLAGLTLAGGCYGSLHLTAWQCKFPSYAETMLWRAASVTILATGPSVVVLGLYERVVSVIDDSFLVWRQVGWIKHALNGLILAAGHVRDCLFVSWMVWYLTCRAFIVVECFIMVAHLPPTALEIPRWAAYIPHIT